MAEIKTKPTTASIKEFIEGVKDENKRKDSYALLEMMQAVTGEKPKMWGTSMIGFGMERIKSQATGREVDWFKIGFSPRKTSLSVYLTCDISKYSDLLKKLGKHKTGVGCLYINRLDDVDMSVLNKLLKESLKRR